MHFLASFLLVRSQAGHDHEPGATAAKKPRGAGAAAAGAGVGAGAAGLGAAAAAADDDYNKITSHAGCQRMDGLNCCSDGGSGSGSGSGTYTARCFLVCEIEFRHSFHILLYRSRNQPIQSCAMRERARKRLWRTVSPVVIFRFTFTILCRCNTNSSLD